MLHALAKNRPISSCDVISIRVKSGCYTAMFFSAVSIKSAQMSYTAVTAMLFIAVSIRAPSAIYYKFSEKERYLDCAY